MSRNFSASQFETAYAPHKLGNWEVPDAGKARPGSGSTTALKTADGRTIPIVNEKGHIVKGGKRKSAFVPAPAAVRWPQANPTIKGTSAATMGYKGIQTDYLPASTVPIRTVEIPGVKECCYH